MKNYTNESSPRGASSASSHVCPGLYKFEFSLLVPKARKSVESRYCHDVNNICMNEKLFYAQILRFTYILCMIGTES